MVRGDAPVRSAGRVIRKLDEVRVKHNQLGVAGRSSPRLGQLTGANGLAHSAGAADGQLISSWRSVPVWTSVVGSERLPDRVGGPCGTMGPCATTIGPGRWEKAWELVFIWETAKGAVGRLCGQLWEVIGERVQEDKWHPFGQSLATDRPRQLPVPLSINIRLWG
ncbi:hypothetical protein F2Q70_00016073 [Brassica cretica]|uniref:Uncharacterized protein n=1 Tax=Brassica cretica TaxID=69181 RepID=A0A8S9I6F9_BRACR|nr:hypothetical protein F2Q70_00016073 [Brassica cretica]KAF2600127.1 hypothetical protein F2Q68_00009002 [Brassica cretica]